MKKPYKKLIGNRIYLKMPRVGDEKVIVDHNTREALMKEFKSKMMRATIYDVGDTVKDFAEGQVVLVDDKALANAAYYPLDGETTVILVSPFDIIHIWE